MTASSRKVFSPRLLACLVVTLMLFTLAASMPAFAGAGGCKDVNAIASILDDPNLAASFTLDANNEVATYSFTSYDSGAPYTGIPGLITYCIYPNQPPGNPSSAAADTADGTAGAEGNDGSFFKTEFKTAQGYFDFTRNDGDPSNIPFDGSTRTMGTATWPDAPGCDPTLGPCGTAPAVQTIALHINDAAECQALYGDGSSTCFVIPTGSGTPPPPPLCNGNPACKSVVIDEADPTTPLTVPGNTVLHIHYTYVIVNQPTNTFNMYFFPPTAKTNDINSGGGKDYWGCEQGPDPNGQPGLASSYPQLYLNYQGTGFNLNMMINKDTATCPQSRFFLQAPAPIVLTPGQSVSFTIDMVTRQNKAGKQEYTSCGLHLLNSGFTVKWFEANNPKSTLYSFSTNITPIYVNVVSGGKLVCQ